MKFIKFCEDNNILVENGHVIEYTWNNKTRRYVVDFYIPNPGILVELKDNHIWHKKQINNGMWKAKMNAVNKYIANTNTEYEVIFPKNFVEKTNLILGKI